MKIRKKASGKFRLIHNPDKDIRTVQYRLNSNLFSHVEIPDYIHGFERGRSIPQMSVKHIGAKCIISMDIEDFFPSIKQQDIAEILKAMGMGETPADVVSNLCTYKAFVPQGALTSPKVSNIVAATTFGPPIAKFCEENNLRLTIYADDVTISVAGDDPRDHKQVGALVGKTIRFVTETLKQYRFYVNREKTKVMWPHNRQWVCGVVVNDKVNMLRKTRDNLRAIVHNCVKNGIEHEAARARMPTPNFIRKYGGMINWLCQLNPTLGNKLKAQFKELADPLMKMYPDFDIDKLAYMSGIELPFEEPTASAITEVVKTPAHVASEQVPF